MTLNLGAVLTAYVDCALWSSTDFNDAPLDDNYGPDDLAPEALEAMRSDVAEFTYYCQELGLIDSYSGSAEQFGHDFWLTRNGHGAGFWDRGLGELGNQLTDAAKSFGPLNLYVSDGQIHC